MLKDIGFFDKDGNYIEDIQEIDEMEMKEVIIDGVNVAECCALDKNKKCQGQYDCEDEICAFKYNELLDETNKVKSLNRDLKQENAELKAELNTYKRIWNNPEVHIALTDVRTGERKLWYENCIKYKQTLNAIKEIAEEYIKGCVDCSLIAEHYECEDCTDGGMAILGKKILDIITKAEVGE